MKENSKEITRLKRYLISGIRLFLSSFTMAVIYQLSSPQATLESISIKAIMFSAGVSALNTVVKYAQENKILDKIITNLFRG